MDNRYYMNQIMKFNSLQFNRVSQRVDISDYCLDIFSGNDKLEKIYNNYKEYFGKEKVKNISFSMDGFFALFLSLEGKIAVSVGESEYIVRGAKKAKEHGVDIFFIPLNKEGLLDMNSLDDSFDFLFVSSYITDTYVKVDLQKIKEQTKAVIVSNATANRSVVSDIYLLDSYKLCGLGSQGIMIFDDEAEGDNISQIDLLSLELTLNAYQKKKKAVTVKNQFLKEFQKLFQNDLYLFVDPSVCLDFTLHLGLKDIKMRDVIRTLAFENIYITNGEGCSLGLSHPSRIIQEMGYNEDESRWGLSLDFSQELGEEDIKKVVEKIYKKYRQIKVLG